jgi:dGTPase
LRDLVEHSAAAGDIVQGPQAGPAMDALRTFMFDHVYLAAPAREEHQRIHRVVSTLFHHYADHPEELPPGDGDLAQRVTDWIAGMTDRYCLRAFRDLAVPRAFAS